MGNVFFVGAGASLPAPAGLPLFRHLWKAAEVGLNPELRGRLQYLAPEPLFRALDLARVPVESVLLEIFNSATARPNAVHFVLARRLLDGDVVWTTNYDTLIEDALAALTPSTVAESAALENLRKPHGTFVRGDSGEWERGKNLVFKADQVVVSWPGELETLLENDCTGRTLVLLGYSGIDVNTYPALRRAFRAASAVTWWAVKRDRGDPVTDVTATTEFRFPELDRSNMRAFSDERGDVIPEDED